MRVPMGQAVTIVPGLSIVVYRSRKDRTLVLEIDGCDALRGENELGPILRVYLNDAPIFENPPYSSPD